MTIFSIIFSQNSRKFIVVCVVNLFQFFPYLKILKICYQDNISKFITDILVPIQNRNGFSVANSQPFSNEIADVNIQDKETMVSFDVVSLRHPCRQSLLPYQEEIRE